MNLIWLKNYSLMIFRFQKPYKLEWSRQDGQNLAENVATSEGGELTIDSVKAENAGSYVCTGTLTDGSGTSNDKAELSVKPCESDRLSNNF